ncbi:hypothetical protein SSM1_135 [Synechococcus phage S-SM1]|uniref:Uncharacterized protein n=1 Tax=Synechococcus phage S-SM1 TaxID=444859 RepID=E3SIE2_9CAUD|nr:hypothetical protein SSM1_135 [Synechococcus phage S-SM1]ADO97215.1 hypothetical protein SSM1_135 [Synechococcus phage S-SM1]
MRGGKMIPNSTYIIVPSYGVRSCTIFPRAIN